jgi:hypothetical protein
MFVEQERWFSFTPDYRPVNDRPVKTDDFEVVVQLHKKFVGATLCGRRSALRQAQGVVSPSNHGGQARRPYIDAALKSN